PQALEIIRGCRGLDLVGGDLVEVAPPYDPTGNTALTGANLLFEMLCVLPGVVYRNGGAIRGGCGHGDLRRGAGRAARPLRDRHGLRHSRRPHRRALSGTA